MGKLDARVGSSTAGNHTARLRHGLGSRPLHRDSTRDPKPETVAVRLRPRYSYPLNCRADCTWRPPCFVGGCAVRPRLFLHFLADRLSTPSRRQQNTVGWRVLRRSRLGQISTIHVFSRSTISRSTNFHAVQSIAPKFSFAFPRPRRVSKQSATGEVPGVLTLERGHGSG